MKLEPSDLRSQSRDAAAYRAAALNGKSVGLVALRSGWQEVTFRVPAPAWRYGFNVLDLHFSYAMAEAGVPAGAKRLSVAIDRISVD